MSFVFYDFETTGISTTYDQPLQFAAILTDARFSEIERINLRCRIAPHVIPSPHALIVTGIPPQQLIDPTLPSFFSFSQSIMDLFDRWTPATWIGFNSIRFDEELLRQTFYQNLQPKLYATQLNGNKRLDILTTVYSVWCRNKGLLNWPTDSKGRTSFKLDRLAPANGYTSHNAHDALGDVEATLHITRIIANGDPELWSAILYNRDKKNVISALETFHPVELITRFNVGVPRSFVGCFCGTVGTNATQAAFFDLDAGNPEDLILADDAALLQATEGRSPIIRSVSTNKVPALFPIADPEPDYLRKADLIARNPNFRDRAQQAIAARSFETPKSMMPTVEKQIYREFYTKEDQNLLVEFQRADWSRRQEITNLLSDSRLRQLGRRLIAFYAPNLLTSSEMAQFKNFIRERWTAQDVDTAEWTTIASSKRAIAELRAKPNVDQSKLDQIELFITEIGLQYNIKEDSYSSIM